MSKCPMLYCHCFSLSKIDVLLWAYYRNSDVNNKSTEVLSRVTNGMSVYVNISVHYKRKSASSKFKVYIILLAYPPPPPTTHKAN